jgi:hypothetical protein
VSPNMNYISIISSCPSSQATGSLQEPQQAQ